MGDYLRRDPSDPNFVPDGGGMNAEQAKVFAAMAGVAATKQADPRLTMATLIASQTGKSVEEVLAFMGPAAADPAPVTPPVVAAPAKKEDPSVFLPEDADAAVAAAPITPAQHAKPLPAPKEVPADGFVVTEVIDPSQATQAELDQAFPEEEENNWDGKIREGSKVRVTYTAPGSRIKWAGKIGTVIRVIGNEKAKVYEVSFKGQKIAKTRLNKVTGKLERGFENKKLTTTFDQEDIELYS
jgi:hypothetical protein